MQCYCGIWGPSIKCQVGRVIRLFIVGIRDFSVIVARNLYLCRDGRLNFCALTPIVATVEALHVGIQQRLNATVVGAGLRAASSTIKSFDWLSTQKRWPDADEHMIEEYLPLSYLLNLKYKTAHIHRICWEQHYFYIITFQKSISKMIMLRIE